MPDLPASFIASLITELKSPAVVGITMAGSFSRGQGTKYSDVDIQLYVTEKPKDMIGTLTLKMFQGYLVSLHYDNLEEERAKLSVPWDAVWAVPGIRQCKILYDENGLIADLKRAAEEFVWELLQPLANQYASRELMATVEEVYKILGGLSTFNESKVLHAGLALVMNLEYALIVQRGILIESENLYFDLIQEVMGRDSDWTRLFRLSFGLEAGDYQTRGSASLALFRETAKLLDPIIQESDREVILHTLELIRQASY